MAHFLLSTSQLTYKFTILIESISQNNWSSATVIIHLEFSPNNLCTVWV